MTFFISARAKFLSRFEPRSAGFHYRPTPRSRAIHVSADERAWLLSEFDRSHAHTQPVLLAAFLLAVIVSICLWQVPSAHPYGGMIFWLTVIGVAAGCGLYFDRRTRSFGRGRVCVDEGLSGAEAGRRERGVTSWAYLLTMLFFGVSSIREALRTDDRLTQIALVCGGGLAVAYNLWVVSQKLRDRLRDQRASGS